MSLQAISVGYNWVCGSVKRALTIFALLYGASGASADTASWVGGTSNWQNAANWSPAAVPKAGDAVVIAGGDGAPFTVTYDVPITPTYPSLGALTIDLTGGDDAPGDAATLFIPADPARKLDVSDLVVGDAGHGGVTQAGGQVISLRRIYLGAQASGAGHYRIDGGRLSTDQGLSVGSIGHGDFLQTGGEVSTSSGGVTLAGGTGSSGSYRLQGGSLVNTGSTVLGLFGVASFEQTGGEHRNQILDINRGSNYTLADGKLFGASVNVSKGQGATLVQMGGTQTFTTMSIGAAGNVHVSGGTASGSNIFVGGTNSASTGAGLFTVSGGAAVTISDAIKLWNSPGSALRLQGGTLSVGKLDLSLNPGGFDWTGGNLTLTKTGSIMPSLSVPAGRTLELPEWSGATATVTGTLHVSADGGQVTLNGGTLTVGELDLAGNPAGLVLGNAHLVITGPDGLRIGAGSAVGDRMLVGDPVKAGSSRLSVNGRLTIDTGANLTIGPTRSVTAGSVVNHGSVNVISLSSHLSVVGTLTNDGQITGGVEALPGSRINGSGTFDRLIFRNGSSWERPDGIVLRVSQPQIGMSYRAGEFGVDGRVTVEAPEGASDTLTFKTVRLSPIGSSLSELDSGTTDVVILQPSVAYANYRDWSRVGKLLTTTPSPAPGHPLVVAPVENRLLRLSDWRGAFLSDGTAFDEIVLTTTYAGDANLDGIVSEDDFRAVVAHMGMTGASYLQGDVNLDGTVTAADFELVTAHLGAGSGGEMGTPMAAMSGPRSVPEPSGGLVIGITLSGLCRRRRHGC
jgi:hypothetical protein